MNKKLIIINFEKGFTYIEAIIYVTIISIMLTSIIPFAWDIIEGGSQSSVQQEVSSNTRYVSERIKYEIRNASGINSVSPSSISLANNTNGTINPTVITYSSPNVTIKQGVGSTVNLNSNDVTITGFSFINNTAANNSTKDITFGFTSRQTYAGSRSDFKYTMSVSSSAELRSH